jgi:hypothetical protein
MATDEKDADAKERLLQEVGDSKVPWSVRTEQALTPRDLFVARLTHTALRGHVTIEASGHRRAGGYEYLVSVFDADGAVVQAAKPFSYPGNALHWARTWLGGC